MTANRAPPAASSATMAEDVARPLSRDQEVLVSQPPSGPPSWGPPGGAWAWGPPPRGPVSLDQPLYDATMTEAVRRVWLKRTVFSGRASRSEYWWWALASFIVSAVLQAVGAAFSGGIATTPQDLDLLSGQMLPALVWSVLVLVPTLAVGVRRLHDANRSGWWYLLGVPANVASALELYALRSFDPARLAVDGLAGLDLVPLVVAGVALLVALPCSVVLLVFQILGPDPRGRRFDRVG